MWMLNPAMMDNVYGPGTWKVEVQYINDSPIKGINKALKITVDSFDTTTYRQGYGGGPVIMSGTPNFNTMTNGYFRAIVKVVTGKINLGFCGDNGDNCIVQDATYGWKEIHNADGLFTDTVDSTFYLSPDVRDGGSAEIWILEYGLYENINPGSGNDCCCEYEYDCEGNKILSTDYNAYTDSCTDPDGPCAYYDECGVCSNGYQSLNDPYYDYSTGISGGDLSFGGDNLGCGCFRGSPPIWHQNRDFDDQACNCQSETCIYFDREWVCTDGTNINSTYDTQALCQVDVDGGTCNTCAFQPIDTTDYGYGKSWKYCLPDQFPSFGDSLPWDDNNVNPIYPFGYFPVKATIPIYDQSECIGGTIDICGVCDGDNSYCGYPTPAEIDDLGVMPVCSGNIWHDCNIMSYINEATCQTATSGNPACYCFQRPYTDCTYDAWTGNWVSTCDWPITTVSAQYQVIFFNIPETGAPDDFWRCGGACLFDVLDGLEFNSQYVLYDSNQNTILTTNLSNTWVPPTGNGGQYIQMQIGQSISPITFQFGTTGQYDTLGGLFSFAVAMTSGGWDEVISNFDPLTPTDTICGEAPCSYCPGYLLDTDTDGNTDIIGSGNCLESGRCESATMTYLESGTSCGCAYDATDCLNHCVNPNTMPEGLNFDLAAANWGWDDCDVCYGGSADGSYISNYNDENPTCNFDPDCWDQVLNEDGLIIDVTWVGTVGNKCPSNSHYDCHCSCPASFEAAAGLYSLGGNYSGAAFIDDCGSCVAGLTYMPVRWNKDSCGNCNGTSWILPIIDPFGSSTFTADGSGGIRYPHAVTNINKIKITDATQIFYPTKINNKLYTESSEILQDFSYCDEERRILTNATSGGDLNIWANELQLHINKNGGTNNYKPCFSRTSSTNHACGDLNDDGVINILDVILLLNLVLSGSYDPCADLNGDGNLNILDMVRIINCIVGSNDCEFTNCECGVCPGETDECGVCMGDNSSCADCAGVPNGGAVEDECGVCDGDGSSCADDDCAGVPGGDAVVDECGVCDGDNSSCADCAGVTNGDAEEDCNGVCDGGAEECMESGVCCESPAVCCPQTGQCCSSGDCDLCGVCDGDDTGYLCPYSGSVVCNEDMCQTSFCTSGDSDGSVYEDIAACEADLGCTSCNYYIPGWEITDPINVDSGTCNGSLITPGNHMYLCLVDGNVYSHTQACDTSYGVAACCGGTSGGGGCRACVYLGDKGVQHTGVNLGDWAECTGLACDSCTGTPNGYMCNYGFANSTLGCDCACGAGWENDDCDVCGGDGTLCRGCKSDDAAVLNCQDHYFLCPSGCAAPIQTIFDEDGDGSLDDEADYFKTQYLWCDGNAVSCANAEWKTCDPPDGKAGCTKKWKDDGMGGAYLHSEHDTWGHDSDVGCVGFKDFSARYPDDPLSCLYDIECTSIFGPRYKDKYCEPPGGWWDSAVTTSHNSWYSSINLSPVEWGTSSYNINSQITYNQLVTNPVDDDIEEAIWGYSDATVGEEFTYSQCINFVNTCSEDYNQPWGGGYEPACCTQFFCGIDLYNQSISPYDIYTLQEEAADLDIDYGFCGVPGPNGRGSLENLNYSGYQFHNMGMWGWSASDSIPMSRNKEEPAWRCQNDNDCYQYGVDAPDETALNPYTKCIKHRDRYNFYKCTPGDILYNWDNGELPYGPDSVGGECFVYTDSRYGTDYVDASGNKGTGYGEDDGDSTDSAVMTCEDGNCPDGQYPIDEVEWMIGHGKPRNLGYFSSISECKLDAPDIYNTDASDHDPLCQRACRANMYLWDPPRWTCTGGEEEGTTYWDEEQCLGSVKVECKGVYCPNQACNPSETMWNSNETYCVRTDDSDCPSSSEEYSRCKYASNNCSAGAANCYQDPGDFCNRFIYPGGVCCDYDELWNTDCDVRCGVCDVNTAACPPAPACENTNFTDTSACTDTSDPSTAEDSYGYACTSGSDSYQDCVQSYLDDGNSEYDSRNWCGCFFDIPLKLDY